MAAATVQSGNESEFDGPEPEEVVLCAGGYEPVIYIVATYPMRAIHNPAIVLQCDLSRPYFSFFSAAMTWS